LRKKDRGGKRVFEPRASDTLGRKDKPCARAPCGFGNKSAASRSWARSFFFLSAAASRLRPRHQKRFRLPRDLREQGIGFRIAKRAVELGAREAESVAFLVARGLGFLARSKGHGKPPLAEKAPMRRG
jgi:hypothetical protein